MVKVRAPVDDVGALLPLAGKALDLAGHKIRLGVPRVLPLIPAASLKARVVTIKGFTEDDTLSDALRRKLAILPDLGQDPERVEIAVGKRRVMRVGSQTIVGFAVALGGLEAQASIVIQAYGLGGRRHMGAGVFVPGGRR
jgi:CRISPR-associated protein Cas6